MPCFLQMSNVMNAAMNNSIDEATTVGTERDQWHEIGLYKLYYAK